MLHQEAEGFAGEKERACNEDAVRSSHGKGERGREVIAASVGCGAERGKRRGGCSARAGDRHKKELPSDRLECSDHGGIVFVGQCAEDNRCLLRSEYLQPSRNEGGGRMGVMAAVENDPVKRKQMFVDFQRIVAEEIPDIPLYSPLYLTIKNVRVHDDSLTADGVEGNMAAVWLDA